MTTDIIPLSYPGAKDSAPKTGMAALSPTVAADDYCKACEDPYIVPIYPVRIAYADLLGELDDKVQYPSSIKPYLGATGVAARQGFTLRTLRKGYVYIYDKNNDIWSIFAYVPQYNHFDKMRWQTGTPDGEWANTQEGGLKTPYVPSSAQTIWIAFSAHQWSAAIFQKAHNDPAFRDQVMLKTDLLNPAGEAFMDNLDTIAQYVEDYTADGFTNTTSTWNSLSDLAIQLQKDTHLLNTSTVAKAKGKPLMVALHDPLGVASEMAMSHLNRMLVRMEYLESHSYAITSARAATVFQDQAADGLKSGDTKHHDMYQKWQSAIDTTAANDFLTGAETSLKNYDDAVAGILAAWKAFYARGEANPNNTLGSLQTHLTTFNTDGNTALPREIADLLEASALIVHGLSASQAGQEAIRAAILAKGAWDTPGNFIANGLKITNTAIEASQKTATYLSTNIDAASDLLTDLAVPSALEIENLNRTDILKEINRFSKGMINHEIKKVSVPIDDALHEIMTSRPKPQQRTKLIQRGHTLHTTQTPTDMYKFDGKVHVSGKKGFALIANKLGNYGAKGISLLLNALDMVAITNAPEKDQLKGAWGRLGDPKVALGLTLIQASATTTELAHKALAPQAKNYGIKGHLSRKQLKQLLNGTDLTDDFLKSITNKTGAKAIYRPHAAVSTGSRLMTGIGRLGAGAGIGLALLDLFSALEASNRGDTAGFYSHTSLALGGFLMAVSPFITTLGLPGVLMGALLVVIGLAVATFKDDPVTRWLKNSFWGTSENYLFWNDMDREEILVIGGGDNNHDSQLKMLSTLANQEKYDFAKFFQREIQEFHELIYWPQVEVAPALKPTRTIGMWPFTQNTTRTQAPRKSHSVRFRLPNFVDGISELDAKVYASISIERQRRSQHESPFSFQYIDVTEQFTQNLTIVNGKEGILESSIIIDAPMNQDQMLHNNIYWDITRLYLTTGWQWSVHEGIQLPMHYHDYWIADGWEVDKVGGKQVLKLN